MFDVQEIKRRLGPDFSGFYPWIGGSYFDQSPRILILGESHYDDADEDRSPDDGERCETIKCFKETLRSSGHDTFGRYWIKTARIVIKAMNYKCDPITFACVVSFYNYCNMYVSRVGRAPSTPNFENSFVAFKKVLSFVRPHLVIACSKRLYMSIPEELDGPTLNREFDGLWIKAAKLKTAYPCTIVAIKHPSRASNKEEVRRLVTARQFSSQL
jgi:hypothetical protein